MRPLARIGAQYAFCLLLEFDLVCVLTGFSYLAFFQVHSKNISFQGRFQNSALMISLSHRQYRCDPL